MCKFEHGFAFDDEKAVVENPDVKLQTTVSELLSHDFWGFVSFINKITVHHVDDDHGQEARIV